MSSSGGPSGPLYKYAFLVSYLGTRYCGWQRQDVPESGTEPSIQGTIEEVLRQITGEEKVSVVGSGRTDSGVHATGQVAHFTLRKKEWDPRILIRALNSVLHRHRRAGIQVLGIQRVPIEFHAQRSAVKKQYSYYFQQGPCGLPHLEATSWWIHRRLDQEAMQKALDILKGEHDFKGFQAAGAKVGSTVRTLLEAQIHWEPIRFPGMTPVSSGEFGLVRVRLVGTGFLKQMVRGIAGTLLEIGEGRRPPECMEEILRTSDRSLVGQTAPGRALWLEQVWYDGLCW